MDRYFQRREINFPLMFMTFNPIQGVPLNPRHIIKPSQFQNQGNSISALEYQSCIRSLSWTTHAYGAHDWSSWSIHHSNHHVFKILCTFWLELIQSHINIYYSNSTEKVISPYRPYLQSPMLICWDSFHFWSRLFPWPSVMITHNISLTCTNWLVSDFQALWHQLPHTAAELDISLSKRDSIYP